jgi:hypothetical protein
VGGATPFLFRPSTGPFGSHPDVSFLRAIQQLFVAQPNFTGISQLTIHRTNLCEIAASPLLAIDTRVLLCQTTCHLRYWHIAYARASFFD